MELFFSLSGDSAARIATIQSALEGRGERRLRRQLGSWIVRAVPVETLVPDSLRAWRPLVRDAMLFVVSHLSPARLAPKVVEQLELPVGTPAEQRLLRLIARVPGLQKIGQVLARNRKLAPPLRQALSELENGISDVLIEDIRAVLVQQLGSRLRKYRVEFEPEILSEASVSAVVGFTWRNPETRRRERGVFKVLKPHIPECFAEDMTILQDLATYLARKHQAGAIRLAGLSETLTEIRLLLEREVDFPREQATLLDAVRLYGSVPGVRVPRPIPVLSTSAVTALTYETGIKVTDAVVNPAVARERVAERLAEALVATPALSWSPEIIYHADPHAGNILYDHARDELVLLDWALTESLTRSQRKNVLLLVTATGLRDTDRICLAIERLRETRSTNVESRIIRQRVHAFLQRLPLFAIPGAMDAMDLLEEIGLEGLKFPAALLMFRKASFTLDGVLEDVAGHKVRLESVLARYAATHWAATCVTLLTLLSARDWLELEWSAVTFTSRLFAQAFARPWLPQARYVTQ